MCLESNISTCTDQIVIKCVLNIYTSYCFSPLKHILKFLFAHSVLIFIVFPDKHKDSELAGFQPRKPLPLQPGLHSSRGSVPHPVPSLVPSHLGKHNAAASAGSIHGALAATMMAQRTNEDVWLTRQRDQGQETDGPQEPGLRSPGKGMEPRRDSHR